MALLRDVIYKRGPAYFQLVKLETEKINLKPLKRIEIKFDPFAENVKNIRDFSFFLHSSKVLQTNARCIVKTEVLTDRSKSSATFTLLNGHNVVVYCDNLSCLEIFKIFNKLITPLAPPEDIIQPQKKVGKKKR